MHHLIYFEQKLIGFNYLNTCVTSNADTNFLKYSKTSLKGLS